MNWSRLELVSILEGVEVLDCNQGASQGGERRIVGWFALVADQQPPAPAQPGKAALDAPPMAAQSGAGLHTPAGDARHDPAAAQPGPRPRGVVGLVGVQLVGSAPS